jgi:arginase family enzyme
LGGDHSIGFPTVRGLASVTSKRIGIIHVDRHADIQETDLDERMHTVSFIFFVSFVHDVNVLPDKRSTYLFAVYFIIQ